MLQYELKDEELAAFVNRCPHLQRSGEHLWRGRFVLHATFNDQERRDEFEIEIELPADYPENLPRLREIGGRTEEIARKYELTDLRDLHCNAASRNVCLCVKQEEKSYFPSGSTLVMFVDNLVVPYLYGLSYFDQHGKWSWSEYSHGAFGALEWAARVDVELTTEAIHEIVRSICSDGHKIELKKQLCRPSQNRHCPCVSNRPFRRCHDEAWRGILRVHRSAKKLKLDLEPLFAD